MIGTMETASPVRIAAPLTTRSPARRNSSRLSPLRLPFFVVAVLYLTLAAALFLIFLLVRELVHGLLRLFHLMFS